jgi:alpha,alpha-trehalase
MTISKDAYDAVIFDLDGVITDTASTHSTAWKALFDGYLQELAARDGKPFMPFNIDSDYRQFVDGKPRYEGVRSFLESRGIKLPYGDPEDPPDRETVCGLGNKKNPMFLARLERDGVQVYDSSVKLIHDLLAKGIRTAIVSSSKNCVAILEAAHITDLFEVKVDGVDAARLGLTGKPEADTFLEAAREMGVDPARSIVVEDAIAGVQAGRNGKFGCVLGIDRIGDPRALSENGADVVVSDLAEVVCE